MIKRSNKNFGIIEKTGLIGKFVFSIALLVLITTGIAQASEITPDKVVNLVNEARAVVNIVNVYASEAGFIFKDKSIGIMPIFLN